jgi:hypothetical protein
MAFCVTVPAIVAGTAPDSASMFRCWWLSAGRGGGDGEHSIKLEIRVIGVKR